MQGKRCLYSAASPFGKQLSAPIPDVNLIVFGIDGVSMHKIHRVLLPIKGLYIANKKGRNGSVDNF
jgi:hypothetical protein